MNNVLKRLEKYGVNMTETMERFVDDKDLYLECLTSFLTDACFEGLNAALFAKNYASAFDYAHTLKGVAGNLGLTPLYQAICGIVEPLRNQQYDHLEVAFANVLSEKERLQQLMEAEQE